MPPENLEPALSVETQLALLRQEIGQVKEILNGRGADHETRIRGLEQFKWVQVGVALASGGIASAIGQAFFR